MARSSKTALTTLLRQLWELARRHKISSIVIIVISAAVIVMDQYSSVISQYSSAIIVFISAVVIALSQYGGETPVSAKPAKGAELICRIDQVSDGDTLTALCGKEKIKVRLFGIDAPETRQTPWGPWSRDKLKAMLAPNPQVTIKVRDIDRYGRVVGQIFDIKNRDVGLEMVRLGYAAVYAQYNQDANYTVVQRQAQQAKRGIWSEPGAHQTPWEWRKVNRR